MMQKDTTGEKSQQNITSRSLLFQRVKSLEEENQQLKRELYAKIREIEGLEPWRIPDARSNPRMYPRAPDQRGRSITRCESCLEVKPIHGRGLCSTCYNRWYNRQRRQREKRRLLEAIKELHKTGRSDTHYINTP